jgi:hypothetical protein
VDIEDHDRRIHRTALVSNPKVGHTATAEFALTLMDPFEYEPSTKIKLYQAMLVIEFEPQLARKMPTTL